VTQGKTTHSGRVISTPATAGGWKEYGGEVYRCRVYLTPDTQGGLVATAAGLPDVSGRGPTEAEALAAVTAALRAHGKRPSPESQSEEPPLGAAVRWVIVHP
jgi:hypothetical protein